MSFSYSGNPSDSDLDEVRFYVGDTVSDDELISDEEIQFLIDTWKPLKDDNLFVASVVAETIAAKFAREVSISADGVSIQASELQNKYQTLAVQLREQYKMLEAAGASPSVGGILSGESYDFSIKPLVWSKGMMDNPRAAEQDTGGTEAPFYPPSRGGDGGFDGGGQ